MKNFAFRTRLSLSLKEKLLYFCYAVVNLLPHTLQSAFRLKKGFFFGDSLNIIASIKKKVKRFFQTFSYFFDFYKNFSLPYFPYIPNKKYAKPFIFIVARARIKKTTLFRVVGLSASAARFTVSRAFLALPARRRKLFAAILSNRLAAAIWTRYFLQVALHKFFKALSARLAFILQQRH